MVALALMGIAATTMADFDLSAMPSTVLAERPFAIDIVQSQDRSPYLPPQLHEQTGSGEAGVRVKLRWRRVKLYVPFGPS